MLKIAILEDHDALRVLIADALVAAGYHVIQASNAEELNDFLSSRHIDLLLTDLNLPGENGVSVARRLKVSMPDLYIIMITALSGVKDRIAGYEGGADIYLAKPFSMDELLAAVGNISRRLLKNAADHEAVVSLRLHLKRQELIGTQSVQLSQTEITLLKTMILARDRRAETFAFLQNTERPVNERSKASLEVQMVRLRQKIMSAGYDQPSIRAIRGEGYELLVPIVMNHIQD